MKRKSTGKFNLKAIKRAEALQKSIFGKRKLPDDSAEIIRQVREERAKQL